MDLASSTQSILPLNDYSTQLSQESFSYDGKHIVMTCTPYHGSRYKRIVVVYKEQNKMVINYVNI